VLGDGLTILEASRHTNKLRRGHLRGNEFTIKIRDIDPIMAPRVWRQLRELERRGVPDYFGSQRFGYRTNNHRLGWCVIKGAWQELIDELLGARGSIFPEHQRERRAQYDAGEWQSA